MKVVMPFYAEKKIISSTAEKGEAEVTQVQQCKRLMRDERID